jgi:HlyD family secretion protein
MGMDKKIEKKKGLKKQHIYIAVGSLIFLFFVYSLLFGNNVSTYRAEKDKLSIGDVSKGVFNDYIRVIGTVEPIRFIYLDAIVGGRVEEILHREGTMLKKDDIILRLSNPDLKLSMLNGEANLAEQINFLRNTRIQMEQTRLRLKKDLLILDFDILKKKRFYQQNKHLAEKELVAEHEYLMAKEDYEFAIQSRDIIIETQKNDSLFRSVQVSQMEHTLDGMKMNLELIKEREENLNVKAPIDAQLGLMDAELGQSISSGQRIGQVNDLSAFKVVAQIDEHYIDRIKRDLTASFERQEQRFDMTVNKVYPDVREGTFEIDMLFDNEVPDNIRPGQTYHVELQLGLADEAVLIPKGGFFQSTGGQWIYVLNENGTEAVKRSIRIGRMNPKYYEVIEGLNPGEKVITSGYDVFGDNEVIVFK